MRGGHEYIVNSAALRALEHRREDGRAGRRTHHALSRRPAERRAGRHRQGARARCRRRRRARASEQIADRVAEYKTLNAAGLTTRPPSRHLGRRLPAAPGDAARGHADDARQRAAAARRQRAGGGRRARRRRASRTDEGDEWLRVGGIKLAVDGGFEGGLMREPYEEPWGEKRHVPRPADHRHRALRSPRCAR